MDASEHRNLASDVRAGLKRKLRWRLNRLRCMTPAEVAFRVARAVQAQAERGGLLAQPEAPAPDLAHTPRPWVHADAQVDAGRYLATADRIAEGWLEVFALKDVDLGTPPRWNRDPKTGIEAPRVYGKLLDYRDPDLVGDIKYLWEPNRHLHFVTLAQAYALSGERRYAHALAEQLESWLVACPYGVGPNWASALEAAIRLVNWSLAWQLLGGASSAAWRDARCAELPARWLRSVYQHAEFVRGWLSRHSSANNHLIGEAAGLFVAGLTWPHWAKSRLWVVTGKRILEHEALAQNAPDGVNREQAVAYQQFVLDFLIVCLLAGKANGEWFSADYESRIETMLDFLACIMDVGGNVPQFGDADDGTVTGLARDGSCPYRSLLATGALLFARGDFKVKAERLDDKSRWLLGAAADSQFRDLPAEHARLPPRQAFPDGGYYVLGAEFDSPGEIRIVADAGPLGYRLIAAHGHADALSFTLSAGGMEFLVDPGTYAYHTQPAWRQYFRGTAAHNTLRVDGVDQSEQGGNFLWLKKARAGCSLWLSSPERDCFEGWHDGYTRLDDPVQHRRLIELHKATRRVIVEDTLQMAGAHQVELFFHCHELAQVEVADGGFRIARGAASVRLVLPQVEGARTALYRGSLSPMAGWVSRRFDVRTPAPTIVWRAHLSGPAVLRSEILIEF